MENKSQEKIKHFTDLDAWRINHELALKIYKFTKDFPREEKFGLTNQLRRAVSSIPANIAEGWGRYHLRTRINFIIKLGSPMPKCKTF